MNTIFTGFFGSTVMMDALLPSLLIAAVTASMSVMVMAHRLSFLAVGVSHATLAGLGLSVFLSLPLLPTATITAVVVALLLTPAHGKQGISEDAGTGILFAGAMATGVILLSTASKSEVDLFGLLFGNILTISGSELDWLLLVGALIAGCMLFAARTWWLIAFDPDMAASSGLPVSMYRMLLYGMVGLTVVMCVKLAGIVLTTGLLVLPAACAWFWAHGLASLWLYSLIFSIAGTFLGLITSYAFDSPSGATVVLTLCIMFIISWGAAWLKKNVLKHA